MEFDEFDVSLCRVAPNIEQIKMMMKDDDDDDDKMNADKDKQLEICV